MLFIAFYVAAQINISDVHIHLKKTTYKPYSIVIMRFLSYIHNILFFLRVTILRLIACINADTPNIIYINK